MRILTFACLISLALASPARGQGAGSGPFDPVAFLRARLAIPPATAVTVAPDASASLKENARLIPPAAVTLPDGIAHRVYIDVGDRKGLRANLTAWVDKWNRKEGKKRGRLEIVSDVSRADVILARYAGEEVVLRPAPVGRRYARWVSYVIVRRPGGLEILWHSRPNVLATDDPGIGFWVTFSTMLGAPSILPPPER